MKVSRKWLQTFFHEPLPSASELADLFNAHAFEVEGVEQVGDDWVIDIDILPNRSSDCLSHRGIARELSTLLSKPMKTDPLREPLPSWEVPDSVTVQVDDMHLCRRYMAGIVRGVRVRPSPTWLKNLLETLGQRSINNVVDATNYIMLQLGQPVHAFDLSLLSQDERGVRGIQVRLAKEGERITTLTGDEYVLKTTHQLITDSNQGTPLALAGIKGGKAAEVTEGTVDLLVEVASFDPVTVRKASNELKLHTDASLRYQNDPAAHLTAFAMRDVLQLLSDIADGVTVGVVDVSSDLRENDPISLSFQRIQEVLGLKLAVSDVEEIFMRLEWEFSFDGTTFTVTGPWERTDVTIPECVIEEIGRIYGYSNIPSNIPNPKRTPPKVNREQYYTERIQRFLTDEGFSEVLTYTLTESGEVELQNPYASDKAFLRLNLRDGIVRALELNAQNAPLLGLDTVKLFEIGTVFTEQGERLLLSLGVRAVRGKQKDTDTEVKKIANLVSSFLGQEVEVQVRDGVCEFPLYSILPILSDPGEYENSLPWNTEARFERWSAYPFMLRDIAVWVPKGVAEDDVVTMIRNHATNLLVRLDVFDVFEKDGRISYALHLVFQSSEKTLTDDELNGVMGTVAQVLTAQGWQVR